MKVVILAGGFGTRISEESETRPKPMIEIGGYPILWHIMKHYSYYGFHDFIICAGYKQHMIKEYFANYYLFNSDVTFDFSSENRASYHKTESESWRVTVVDTGYDTMTGGRVKRIQKYIGDEDFLLTYGDGVSNINLHELVSFHQAHGKIGTISSYNLEQRFGVMDIDEDSTILSFREKAKGDGVLINIGFMVFKAEVFKYISDDTTIFERETLHSLALQHELKAYKHDAYWQCMDTKRDMDKMNKLYEANKAPWKVW